VSVSVAVVRDSFERFDGIMPRFTLPSSLTPYIFACRIQRAGTFEIEDCELGELVPRFKYDVCLEEIDEILEEYPQGPFFAGEAISAADIFWAPFLERFGAMLPMLYPAVRPRDASSRYEALSEWYDAMDELVPCWAARVKGRAATWQERLREEPYLEGKLEESPPGVPELPSSSDFDAHRVWSAYAEGRPHVAPTAAEEAAAVILRNRNSILASTASACPDLDADDHDAALRELCAGLASWGELGQGNSERPQLSSAATSVACHLDAGSCEGWAVPRDVGVLPAEALRSLLDDGVR
jgi:glutathione S-transferase